MCLQNRPIPMEPDYRHKYYVGLKSKMHNDPRLQSNDAPIDPHTGIIYERYNRNRPDVLSGGDKNMDTYCGQNRDNDHIYNTLEPYNNTNATVEMDEE